MIGHGDEGSRCTIPTVASLPVACVFSYNLINVFGSIHCQRWIVAEVTPPLASMILRPMILFSSYPSGFIEIEDAMNLGPEMTPTGWKHTSLLGLLKKMACTSRPGPLSRLDGRAAVGSRLTSTREQQHFQGGCTYTTTGRNETKPHSRQQHDPHTVNEETPLVNVSSSLYVDDSKHRGGAWNK
jgi:hypothetical protein